METTIIYWGYMERMENGNYYESAAFQRLLLGGFSRLGVPFWGVPIIRATVFLGSLLGSPYQL